MKASLQLYRRLLGTIVPYWRVVAISIAAMVLAAGLEPVMPTLLKSLVDKSLIQKDPVAAWQLPLFLMLTFLGKGLAEYVTNVASQWVANKAVADLRQQVFHHQTALPLATHLAEPPGRTPAGASRCQVTASQLRPLIVEWEAADRASLEVRLRREGLVAVRYAGCELEVLRCQAAGKYHYSGVTVKQDGLAIESEDDLYEIGRAHV